MLISRSPLCATIFAIRSPIHRTQLQLVVFRGGGQMPNRRRTLLSLTATISLGLLALVALLLAVPLQSTQAAHRVATEQAGQTDAMTGTMPMMGDMMSMTANMMDMMSMMGDMPMTGTMS